MITPVGEEYSIFCPDLLVNLCAHTLRHARAAFVYSGTAAAAVVQC